MASHIRGNFFHYVCKGEIPTGMSRSGTLFSAVDEGASLLSAHSLNSRLDAPRINPTPGRGIRSLALRQCSRA